jgi:hypothetical protein
MDTISSIAIHHDTEEGKEGWWFCISSVKGEVHLSPTFKRFPSPEAALSEAVALSYQVSIFNEAIPAGMETGYA